MESRTSAHARNALRIRRRPNRVNLPGMACPFPRTTTLNRLPCGATHDPRPPEVRRREDVPCQKLGETGFSLHRAQADRALRRPSPSRPAQRQARSNAAAARKPDHRFKSSSAIRETSKAPHFRQIPKNASHRLERRMQSRRAIACSPFSFKTRNPPVHVRQIGFWRRFLLAFAQKMRQKSLICNSS